MSIENKNRGFNCSCGHACHIGKCQECNCRTELQPLNQFVMLFGEIK